jgi:hypothetical protein
MNISPKPGAASPRGVTLIEMLVYMALLMVVLATAYMTAYNCWDSSKALRRNADDIERALDIGEHWRADVRAAKGPILTFAANGVVTFRIPASAGEIVYTFSNGEIRRQAGPAAPATLWLSNVKSSQMLSEPRAGVIAFRWELELNSSHKGAGLRPLFTFECAPAAPPTR